MKLEIEIPAGKKAEWVNGVLALVDKKPAENKFCVGDKVKCPTDPSETYEIKSIVFQDGKYLYYLESEMTKTVVAENLIEPISNGFIVEQVDFKFNVGDNVLFRGDKICKVVNHCTINNSPLYTIQNGKKTYNVREEEICIGPKDITDIIKTFEDAADWCYENNTKLWQQWQNYDNPEDDDVEAYLKLRIIASALNEGWKPEFSKNERRWYAFYHIKESETSTSCDDITFDFQKPASLMFKSERLAEYAAHQFSDIYAQLMRM